MFDFNTTIQQLITWSTTKLPEVAILILILFGLLKLNKQLLGSFKKFLFKRLEKDQELDHVETEKRISTLISILQGAIRVLIITITVSMVLSKLGFNIAPLLASAGILGLAIGFGAQELVRDYISGFFLILENQVRVGDVAIINGTGGLVEKIELRTITLRDISGTVHIFQNGKISTIANMTKTWSAMVFDIGVAYKENVEQVMSIMREVGQAMEAEPEMKEKIIEPLEVSGLNEFADSALVIRARLKTKPGQQWELGREYRKRLKVAFDKNNIEIPFPHTTIYWGEEIKPLTVKNQNTKQN